MNAPNKRTSKTPWLVAAVVVIALAVIAVVASSGGDDGDDVDAGGSGSVSATQPVEITGDALPPYEKSGTDPAAGAVAPRLDGASFDGTDVVIEPGDGTAKLLVFVAHWCPHCQREVPFLVDHFASSPLPDDVELLTVSTGVDPKAPNYPPQTWLADEGWTAPVLADDDAESAATAYGLTAFPYFVALDADGKVVARSSGELTADQVDDLVAAVRSP